MIEHYHMIETYHADGEVEQRVLASLGRFPTVEGARREARRRLARAEAFMRIYELGYSEASSRLAHGYGRPDERRVVMSRIAVQHLSVVSETGRMWAVPDPRPPAGETTSMSALLPPMPAFLVRKLPS